MPPPRVVVVALAPPVPTAPLVVVVVPVPAPVIVADSRVVEVVVVVVSGVLQEASTSVKTATAGARIVSFFILSGVLLRRSAWLARNRRAGGGRRAGSSRARHDCGFTHRGGAGCRRRRRLDDCRAGGQDGRGHRECWRKKDKFFHKLNRCSTLSSRGNRSLAVSAEKFYLLRRSAPPGQNCWRRRSHRAFPSVSPPGPHC